MWNIKDRGKGEGVKAKGAAAAAGGRLGVWRMALALTLCPFAFALSGCRMDMQDQPKYEAYESSRTFKNGQASRPLVEGTVARGHLREDAYFHTGKAGAGGATPQGGAANVRANTGGGTPGAQAVSAAMGGPDNFPLPLNREALERGRERFQIYCSVCHGAAGDGDGMIPRRGFQRPPSFHEDRLQEGTANAGHFFDVITNGWGAMPSYAEVISAEDRWKIIAYVRALQLSRRMNINELAPDAQGKVRAGARGEPVKPHGLEQPEQPHRGGERN